MIQWRKSLREDNFDEARALSRAVLHYIAESQMCVLLTGGGLYSHWSESNDTGFSPFGYGLHGTAMGWPRAHMVKPFSKIFLA